MPVSVIKARLNALRSNLPLYVQKSVVEDFNSMVTGLAAGLNDTEISHFLISDADVKPRIVSVSPGRGATYSKERFCDPGLFKRQVEGLWEYLEEVGIVATKKANSTAKSPSHQVINIHGDVTGSAIQQGDNSAATLNYQTEVTKIVEEIRSIQNAAKLSDEAKRELRAEVETVEAQIKSPKPKHGIIRESLQSARHILEHAFGAGLAHAYFPLLIEYFKHH